MLYKFSFTFIDSKMYKTATKLKNRPGSVAEIKDPNAKASTQEKD